MRRIENLDESRLRLEEIFGFLKRVESQTDLLTLESDAAMVAAYKAAVTAFSDALYGVTKNPYSKAAIKADEMVDATWRGMRAHVKAMLRYPSEDVRAVAESAFDMIEKYGDITQMGHNEEYGALYNLLQELNLLGVQKQQTIFADKWVEELQANYDAYMAAADARVAADAKVETGATKQARDVATTVYYQFVERVNALALVNGEEPYAEFIDNVNELIYLEKATLSSRNTKAEKGEEPQEE